MKLRHLYYVRQPYGDWRNWLWEFLHGPATIIDGITWTITLGRAGTTLGPLISQYILETRMNYHKEKMNAN